MFGCHCVLCFAQMIASNWVKFIVYQSVKCKVFYGYFHSFTHFIIQVAPHFTLLLNGSVGFKAWELDHNWAAGSCTCLNLRFRCLDLKCLPEATLREWNCFPNGLSICVGTVSHNLVKILKLGKIWNFEKKFWNWFEILKILKFVRNYEIWYKLWNLVHEKWLKFWNWETILKLCEILKFCCNSEIRSNLRGKKSWVEV